MQNAELLPKYANLCIMIGMFHTRSLLRYSTVASVVTGVMLIANHSADAPLNAQLSGQGSTMAFETGMVDMHSAADIAAAHSEAGVQLAMGALFILLGFFLHALLRHRDERNVHITIAPKKRPTMIDKREWYWVHLHV